MEKIETIEQNIDDEIDLLDLFVVLWRRKWIIIGITVLAAVFIVLYSIVSLLLAPEKSYLPNTFTPKAHMLIDDSSSGGGISSMLSSSELGGLAALAGLNVKQGKSFSALALYITESNPFLDEIVHEFDLINKWEIEKNVIANSRDILKKKLKSEFDDKSSVFSISFTDIDPVFAQAVINFSVSLLEKSFADMGLDKNELNKINLEVNIQNTYNEIIRLENESQILDRSVAQGMYTTSGSSIVLEATRLKREISAQESIYTQLKTQYELLKVQMASEMPVFQILEYAEVPDRKSGPSRGMLCIIVTFAAFFASVLFVFILNAVENIKKDPVAMAKLKGQDKDANNTAKN